MRQQLVLYNIVHLDSQVDRDDDKADLGDSNYDEFSGYSGRVAQEGSGSTKPHQFLSFSC